MSFLRSAFRAVAPSVRTYATTTVASTSASVGSKSVPLPKTNIATPKDFLTAIGRQCETKFTAAESWPDFWRSSSPDFRKAGVAVRDRRYIMWCMSKYRQGVPIEEFAHPAKAKKTVRGWGPKVQDGKRIRSRRIKD
ncbi:IGR protein motif-domain-containing protein [Pterulicium gracile]|uniref:Small ribosomal subunit protein mS41 n=1 Tax=Pterulicium gracile TaxID=1884261 RepID=A0A5C3QIB1_9AGAR|nr:IGR protein motif-domain-containing protein [Pterula gracilis]